MFTDEELKELKLCVNEMIASRIRYKHSETNEVRLSMNKTYLELDYKLLNKILKKLDSFNKDERVLK